MYIYIYIQIYNTYRCIIINVYINIFIHFIYPCKVRGAPDLLEVVVVSSEYAVEVSGDVLGIGVNDGYVQC